MKARVAIQHEQTPLPRGSSSSVVRASNSYSEGPGFNSQLGPILFFRDFFTLSEAYYLGRVCNVMPITCTVTDLPTRSEGDGQGVAGACTEDNGLRVHCTEELAARDPVHGGVGREISYGRVLPRRR